MPNRRQFVKGALSAVAAAGLSPSQASAAAPRKPQPAAGRIDSYPQLTPMLQLQQEFLDLRFGMFIHMNMATFQDREWGDPHGDLAAFNPTSLDTDSWAVAAQSAGMRYASLTAKHHDGFCLWPSRAGGANVSQTPCKADIVGQYADSFRKHGLKVGLYYSILDLRAEIQHFSITPAKIQRIKDELTELLTNYGPIHALVFDSWDAGWSRITYDEIPFQEIYAHIKRLQPDCLLAMLNAGQHPAAGLYYTDIKMFEQNAGQSLPGTSVLPAQSCVTLTDGWFWKTGDEDRPLKSAEQVVNDWLKPQNDKHCNLIVNAPPNREGRLAPNILARLEEIGKLWRHPGPAPKVDAHTIITSPNLASRRPIRASAQPDCIGPDMANDASLWTCWELPGNQRDGWLEVQLEPGVAFNTLALVEPYSPGSDYPASRLAAYRFEAWDGSKWTPLVTSRDQSPVRLHTIPRTAATKVRLLLNSSADGAKIMEIGIYDEPARG